MSGLSMMVKQGVFRISPECAWRLAAWRSPDTALALKVARALTDPARIAVDIGGSWGLFAAALAGRAAQVHVVEPNPEKAAFLTRCLGARQTIHPVALSDSTGEVTLHIPDASSALATIEAGNPAARAPGRQVTVRRERLDGLGLGPVGFIKMDVEGHEAAALAGGEGLLRRDLPALLIEMEERHRPGGVRPTIAWLESLGYRAFMLTEGGIRDAAHFDARAHQPAFGADGRRPAAYINDFLFIAARDADAALARLKARGVTVAAG